MALKVQDLVQIAQQNKPQPEPGDYAIPKQDIEKQINSMPNANKLTQTEKSIYKALPGVSSWMENNRIFGQTYADQLEKFNNGWMGKALQKLDFLAEGLERTSGLVVQMTDPNFDFKDLKAAWYAGSLTYDTTNLPQLVYGTKIRVKDNSTQGWHWEESKDGKGENIAGLRFPTDLPGTQAGLNDARTKIVQLMQQGVDANTALEQVRSDYYEGVGALALRSQLNDFYGHFLLDPLNWIMGGVKPIEALKLRKLTATTEKIATSAEDIMLLAQKAAKGAETAENALDALKFTDESYRLAQLAGDAKLAVQYGASLPELAKAAGKTEDVARYTEELAKLTGITADAEQAAKYTETALSALGQKQLNFADKAAMLLGGGDPLRPSKFIQKMSEVPFFGVVARAFQLTPESRAREALNMLSDNIGANLISRLWDNPNAEAEFVSAIHRMKKGATGIEYGHSMLTVEGRTVQAFLSGSEIDLTRLLGEYESSAQYRQVLQVISESLGESSEKLLRRMDENPTIVFRQLMEQASVNPVLAEQIQAGFINQDTMRSLAKMFPEGRPYNKEMFFATAMDSIETAAMRQAVVQFGVKAKGVLTRWSDAFKSAESLAFLKINPAYPIRNMVNNDVTMISRGLFGFMNETQVGDFWKALGYSPKRLAEEGLALEVGKVARNSAEQVLQDALQGGHYTTPDQLKNFFQKISLGKLDATEWGGKLEKAASRKATTLGTMQYLREYYKPNGMKSYLNADVLEQIANVSPDVEKAVDNAIRSAGASQTKLDELLGKNLNLNIDSILDDVTETLGTDARQVMGTEVLEYVHQRLPKAIESGNIDAFKVEMRSVLERHVEDLFQKQIQNVVEHTKAQAMVGGPNIWNKKLAEASDLFWGAHIEYSNRMPEATRLARESSSAGDYKLARALWEQEAADSNQFYNRAFRRVDAYIQGLEEGTKELAAKGANVPFSDVRKTFGKWKSSWEEFFSMKNARHDAFWKEFDAAPKGAKPNIDDLQTELTKAYQKQIENEDVLMRQIDDLIAGMIPDRQARSSFVNARDAIAELRKQDKQRVLEMYEATKNMEPGERQAQWNLFWQERAQRYQEIRGVNAAANAIQQGDPQAITMFQGVQNNDIYSLANSYGIPSATEAGARNDKRILATINKYLPEGTEKFKNVADVPEDVARQAFEARALEKGIAPSKVNPNFIAETELKKLIPDQPPIDLSTDLMTYGRLSPMIDNIANEAVNASKKAPLLVKDLPQNLQDEVIKAINLAKNDMASVRYKASKFGQLRRDSALLNYNRRTNFDNWLAHVAPFGFWTTNSMFHWALESIDRPAAITNYLRVKKFMATSGLQRDGMASRTKGKIRIELPFAPDWMGEAFVDPMRMLLPFDNWASPFEQWQKDQQGVDGRTQRTLDQLLAEGKISQEEYQTAFDSRSGETWNFAKNMVLENDTQDRYDAWDFASALQAPHAPLAWAYNAAFGDKENIGPFSPMSRIARNAATLLGVEDWNNSKWNLEAKIRKQLGLPAFDKWDDYRIKRAASNMAGDGSLTPDEAKEAIAIAAMVESGKLSPEEAKRQSEAYKLAVTRSNQEFTGGAGGFIGSLLGLSVTSVPEGESNLRALQDDFGVAYGKYKDANASLENYILDHPEMTRQAAEAQWEIRNPRLAKDGEALKEFFDAHPEYETRLGLFDKLEEQIKKFMVDEVWKTYNELPKVNKDEAREHFGTEFTQTFLDSETRNTDEIPTELMAVWLKMMHVDPKGGLTADQRLLVDLYGKVEFTDPETAWRVQTFYDQRNGNYRNWYDLQTEYYDLPKSQRKGFIAKNPELVNYWDFRRNFMRDNPDLVPYLTDDQKAIERAKNQSRTEQAVPTAQELQIQLPPDVNEVLNYYFQNDQSIPYYVMSELDAIAQQQGLQDGQQLLNIIQGQY